MFDFLAKPCLWLMNYLYAIIPNYGVAIIILTVLSKILLWPLGTKSYKSMSQMKKLQPLIQELRSKYKDDRKKMNEEIMRLHRTYNINRWAAVCPCWFRYLYSLRSTACSTRQSSSAMRPLSGGSMIFPLLTGFSASIFRFLSWSRPTVFRCSPSSWELLCSGSKK